MNNKKFQKLVAYLIEKIDEDRYNEYRLFMLQNRLINDLPTTIEDKSYKKVQREYVEFIENLKHPELISHIEYYKDLIKGENVIYGRNLGITEFVNDFIELNKEQLDEFNNLTDYEAIKSKFEILKQYVYGITLMEISELVQDYIDNESKLKVIPQEQTETKTEKEQPIKSNQYPKMETKEIIESGFVKAFISEYFEEKIYSFYPDKDRLLYVLCSTDIEKQQVTAKQIDIIKREIPKLGNEELSFAYLLSCKPESISGHNYIKPEQRFDFYLDRFCDHFIDSINTFTPIIEACELFKGKLSNEDFEDYFWDIYPANQKPKDSCLPFVIQRESELLNEIEYTISEYKENEYWEFDFEQYQKFIDISKPIELLFNVSELLVQLNRLEMFNEFLLPPRQTETKTDKLKAELGKYGFFELPKVKQLSEPNKQSLVELISTNNLPYSIAMVEYLGFIKYLKSEHFTTDYKLFKAVAKWFEVTERAVKGNIYVLNEHSKENRTRYTADQQKQIVQKDYEKLK